MLTHDKAGHRYPAFRTISHEPVNLTDADIYGCLEPLNLHGPLLTSDLLAFMAFYRDTEKYNRDRLRLFFQSDTIRYQGKRYGPVLDRPPQQFPEHVPPSRAQMVTHALNDAGLRVLKAAGRYHPVKHGGWFEHQVANAHITASLHLAALHDNRRFYTPDEIAEDTGVKVPFAIGSREYESIRLVPDYLFGIDRYYAVETDLGNEVGRAEESHRRKTYERMVLQYIRFIGSRLYYKAYNVPERTALMVLFITTQRSKLDLVKNIIKEHIGSCNFILLKHIPPDSFSAFDAPKPLVNLWTDPWERVGNVPFYLNKKERQ